ncbi:hypothetical protein [Paucisalibacillus globulus]|uniref:hypothetical protein n=1 Tax=Paucisalibacillus globulus TaxID=351095 RepID=UPI000BB7C977|nr:hypothetical protein [Paucisalibacillus globulus]
MEEIKSESNDQAKELRELLQDVNNNSLKVNDRSNNQQDYVMEENLENQVTTEEKMVNVLNLPPRKEIHSQKKNRTHLKISKPFLRLFFVLFLLLIVLWLLLFYGDVIY